MKAHWLDGDGTAAISAQQLNAQGVYYAALDTDPARYQPPVDELKSARGYVAQDVIALEPTTPNLDAICAKFVDEHFHDDDEVRFVLEGEGIFDIRSQDDRWMRVFVERGDLIVVPKDRHHRFLLTEKKQIRCVRLFRDQSGWVPHYRKSA
jgi:1,2-dihydroxy-3-keto-5-methylthiopentene dioxygenase